jgi:hypothetical protein
MITRSSECTFNCYSKDLCSISALALEANIERDPRAGLFTEFKTMEESLS